jgi:hypothetical protein
MAVTNRGSGAKVNAKSVPPTHHATPLTVQGTQTLCGAFEQSAALETLVLDEIPVFFRSSTLDSDSDSIWTHNSFNSVSK